MRYSYPHPTKPRSFILYEDGSQENLVPVTLKRKYPLAPTFAYYNRKMKEGRFLGANRADKKLRLPAQ